MGIGASAGGLEAFSRLLGALPDDTGMGFVLVQHLDPEHESALTQLLSKVTVLPVREATDLLNVTPNTISVIPRNAEMGIIGGALTISPRGPKGGGRSIDHFFGQLAKDQGNCAIGIVLSGTASDGTVGLEAIKDAGGLTFAQDESAKYSSMPRSAIAAGCVDLVLSPEDIARQLAHIARHPYLMAKAASLEGLEHDELVEDGGGKETPQQGLQKIIQLLRKHQGVDYALYKPNTIRRRIARRMALQKASTVDEYAHLLAANETELGALNDDLLIGVTSFFRNPEAFELLKSSVFPKFMEHPDDPVRFWVLGCSTGQEAYSLAMAFAEFCDTAPRKPKLQIFATDVNDSTLRRARAGYYVRALVQDLAPERLRRFFTEEEGGYRIAKSIRETVVFAKQNLLSDPPFSRMHLISCRNLLIYIEAGSQKTIFPKFHYALRPGCFLMLGASESIGSFTHLFGAIDKKNKLFVRKNVDTPALRFGPKLTTENGGAYAEIKQVGGAPKTSEQAAEKEADEISLKRHAPPHVILDHALRIIQFRGDTSAYLKPPTGKASFEILRMAAPGILLPLRAALSEAKQNRGPIRKELNTANAADVGLAIEVVPLRNGAEPGFVVYFEPAKHAESQPLQETRAAQSPETSLASVDLTNLIAAKDRELAEMREYIQSIQTLSESSTEDLQALNEEITSANEELQSINEELETSQEELESSNEELTTVNEEMVSRNTELGILNSDLINFQTAAKIPILLLGRDLSIRRFTSSAEMPFRLVPGDIGRSIAHIRHRLDLPELEQLIEISITSVRTHEREVKDDAGKWYELTIRPYLSVDNRVDGAVLVLTDIDARKRNEAIAETARTLAESIVGTVPDPLVLLTKDLCVRSANAAFVAKLGEPAIGKTLTEFRGDIFEDGEFQRKLSMVALHGEAFDNLRVTSRDNQGELILLTNARLLPPSAGQEEMVLVGLRDITTSDHEEAHRALLMAELDHRLKNTLASILTVARQTRISAPSLDEFGVTFEARLRALSRTHDLLRGGEWRSAQLQDVIRAELAPYGSEEQRVKVLGDDVQLSSAQALALGLAIHELATNAAKYGALSVPEGRVSVSWRISTDSEGPKLNFHWQESGGPPVEVPKRRGFGSEIIQDALRYAIDATVALEFPATGVQFRVTFLLGTPEA